MTAQAAASFMYAPDIERLDRAAIKRLQLERLKRTLAHAYANVPHTRATFAGLGVTPGDLTCLEDLPRSQGKAVRVRDLRKQNDERPV